MWFADGVPMKLTRRFLPALVAAAWLALPGISSEGGEGAGGTGVWILPAAKFVGTAPLAAPTVQSPTTTWVTDLKLTVAPGLTNFTAVLVDDLSGDVHHLPVSGREILLERGELQGLISGGLNVAYVVVADASQLGYVVRIVVDATAGTAQLSLR